MKGGAMTTRDNNLETMDSALSQNYHSLYDDALDYAEFQSLAASVYLARTVILSGYSSACLTKTVQYIV